MTNDEVIDEIDRIIKGYQKFKIVKFKQSKHDELKKAYSKENATVHGVCRTANKERLEEMYAIAINHFHKDSRCLNKKHDVSDTDDSIEYAIFVLNYGSLNRTTQQC